VINSRYRKKETYVVAINPLGSAPVIPEFSSVLDPEPVTSLPVAPRINSMEQNR
jgi:hypothetical protein